LSRKVLHRELAAGCGRRTPFKEIVGKKSDVCGNFVTANLIQSWAAPGGSHFRPRRPGTFLSGKNARNHKGNDAGNP
jgi:hypothetical protein